MSMDNIQNSADETDGRAEEGFGDVTGNESLEAEGSMQDGTADVGQGADPFENPLDADSDPLGGQTDAGTDPFGDQLGTAGDPLGGMSDTGTSTDPGTGSIGDESFGDEPIGDEPMGDETGPGSEGGHESMGEKAGDAVRGIGDRIKDAFNK